LVGSGGLGDGELRSALGCNVFVKHRKALWSACLKDGPEPCQSPANSGCLPLTSFHFIRFDTAAPGRCPVAAVGRCAVSAGFSGVPVGERAA
jgi:hypothetical protein